MVIPSTSQSDTAQKLTKGGGKADVGHNFPCAPSSAPGNLLP
jgi:hypothetical protein